MDLDHTERYVPTDYGGPPGQTRLGNLGPMARPGHRAVTHGGWQKHQPEPGYYIHRSPIGYVYLVTNQGTLALGRTHFSNTVWQASNPKPAAIPAQRAVSLKTADALTPYVLVQRLFDATTLSGRNLGLGIVDRGFGQLGYPISGCRCVHARRATRGQLSAGLFVFDRRRRALAPARITGGRTHPGVIAEGFGDGADRLSDLTRNDPKGVTALRQVRQRLQVFVGQHLGICVVAVHGLENQVNSPGLTVGPEDRGLLVTLRHQNLLLPSPLGGKDLGLPFPFGVQNGCALVALGAHLLLHGLFDGERRVDRLDLDPVDSDSPLAGRFVQHNAKPSVDFLTRSERLLQIHAADDIA